MLLEYGVRNFFCFKEGATVSFKLPNNCPESISQGKEYTNILCVKGKNGSGKTNLLKGLSFLGDFCANSFSCKPDEEINIENFYRNEEDSEFFIEFKEMSINYRYELILNKHSVIKETLFRKDKRKTKIIEREGNIFTELTSEFEQLRFIKLRKNASFISTTNQYEFGDFDAINVVYDFFSNIMSNVNFIGLSLSLPSVDIVTKFFHDDPETFDFVKKIIIACDTGVKDIEIIEQEDEQKKITKYIPVFIHEVDGNDRGIPYHTESSGTKSLYIQLAKYKLILNSGGILCLDEFDINFHPHILPILLQLFTDPEKNKTSAQIIFTTHNSDVLDYLGRYRSYLVDKENNESFAYRLDEIPGDILRNDRPILPIYNLGKIGGVPKL